MPKVDKIIYECTKCGAQYPKWVGRCAECGNWGTIKEGVPENKTKVIISDKRALDLVDLSQVKNKELVRIKTNLSEWDRVLGGGLVRGSLLLLGGDPGIGKSTLALQIAAALDGAVYVSGEESSEQVAQRLARLQHNKKVNFLAETNLENILGTLAKQKPIIAVIDSIQTIYSEEVEGEAGNISQVRACTVKLLTLAKQLGICIIIVGHVTKEGVVAGPKTLEHLVDTVLYLEGDKYQQYRLLRTVKNRFGATGEIGVWEMTGAGLREVVNPSQIFISKHGNNSGTTICPISEGTRIFLVEVQALVNKTNFGYPRRVTAGYSSQRLEILLAVLAKKAKLPIASYDIYINIAGGLSIKEPALDLAVAGAIVSAYFDKSFKKQAVIFGEIGLDGQLRNVNRTKDRVKESLKLGFQEIYIPQLDVTIDTKQKIIQLPSITDLVKLFK